MQKKIWTLLLLICGAFNTASAITGINGSIGFGKPQNLRGGRIGIQQHWKNPIHIAANKDVGMFGYWDMSYAKWKTDGDDDGRYKDIWAIAAAPVLRVQYLSGLLGSVKPFAELSIGAVWVSQDHIANRDLGSHLNFQDTMGLGIQFGDRGQYEISYRFLHYSNLDFAPPNQGVDIVKFITFSYRWDNHGSA